jgi:hypothetical protein
MSLPRKVGVTGTKVTKALPYLPSKDEREKQHGREMRIRDNIRSQDGHAARPYMVKPLGLNPRCGGVNPAHA